MRPRKYYSNAERQRAYRERKRIAREQRSKDEIERRMAPYPVRKILFGWN